MRTLPRSPAPRPASGFTPARAQSWILAAAVVIAVIYGVRRLVEPSLSSAPAKGGTAATLAGAGSPPPTLAHWLVAYGAGFGMLALLALAAPELAGSLALLAAAGSLLTNGTSLVADITGLEQLTPKPVAAAPASLSPPAALAPAAALPSILPSSSRPARPAVPFAPGYNPLGNFGPGPGIGSPLTPTGL
jgi:hypothetical protein